MNEDLVLNELQEGIADLIGRANERYLNCSDMTLEEAERLGSVLATFARDLGFWIGDLSRYAESRWPDGHYQAWPVFQSPGQLARNAGVCRAYPKKTDRQHACTFSQYMQVAGKPDRQKLLEEMVGVTTDESRKKTIAKEIASLTNEEFEELAMLFYRETGHLAPGKDAPRELAGDEEIRRAKWVEWRAKRAAQAAPKPQAARWLLAVDVNYFLHRFWHSGAGIDSAMSVAAWIERTVGRLKEMGLTDVACCFDSHENHRKELTKEWEDKYKDRPPKDPELAQQLALVHDLLCKGNFACVQLDGMEADDVMASYAKQFDGKVTLLTQDKDCRQCLSAKCNMLLDVEWKEDPTSGDAIADYKWMSAKMHTETKGIPPEHWIDYQVIMGDNTDGIRGVEGIGEKGAADLVKEFGTVEAVIAAAKAEAASITPKKRAAIIAFEPKLEITRQLVNLKTDLTVPNATRIG